MYIIFFKIKLLGRMNSLGYCNENINKEASFWKEGFNLSEQRPVRYSDL
jgi:hypothetical protein